MRSILIGALVLGGGFFSLQFALKTTLSKKDFLQAVAEQGPLEATVNGSGEVVPEFEEVIVSPLPGKLEAILRSPGIKVTKGDSILQINQASSLINLDQMNDELDLKRNKMRQLKINTHQLQVDLQTNIRIKKLNIKSLEVDVEDKKVLESIGAGTRKEIEKAKLELEIGKLELEKLENDLLALNKKLENDLEQMAIESGIQQRQINELKDKLAHGSAVAQREGVVTWVNDNLGADLQAGTELARVADLSSYKVEARLADIYAEQIKPGLPVRVKINGKKALRGTINLIKPNVENSIILFEVALDQKDHHLLRPNQQVDVEVVTSSLENVVRIKNGPGFTGAGPKEVFVVENDRLIRKKAKLGWSNLDYIQIESGIQAGETLIISDMTKYEHLESISLND